MEFLAPANTVKSVVLNEQLTVLNAPYTLASQTATQKLFNATANGAITVLAATTYFFESYFDLSALSSTSGSFGFALGGTATLTSQKWDSVGAKVATLTTAIAPQNTANNVGANIAIVTASTAVNGWAKVKGIIRVNAGGTIIPQISLGIASPVVVGINSYFRIVPIGVATITNIGAWS